MKNWLWISGWAVPPTWLAAQAQATWPHARHTAVAPMDAAQALSAENFDALGGYSLGSLWLLRQAKAIPDHLPVVLIAPILAFPAEKKLGGNIPLAQVRLQRRRLRKNPATAIADFFTRAGLTELNQLPAVTEWNTLRSAALDEELSWLEDWQTTTVPKNWRGFIGEGDLLLDAAAVKKNWPRVRIVANTGHTPAPLMKAAKKFFPGTSA